ncbi:MAG: hypothetical protein ACTSQP_24805, partial [Promethearchaeota archaeon]
VVKQRYISSFTILSSKITEYNFSAYTPTLDQLIKPTYKTTAAYIGAISLPLSLIGLLVTLFSISHDLRNLILSKKNKTKFTIKYNSFKFFSFFYIMYFIISLGDLTFIYRILASFLPYFGQLRVPPRWIVVFSLFVSIFAGHGINDLLKSISFIIKLIFIKSETKSKIIKKYRVIKVIQTTLYFIVALLVITSQIFFLFNNVNYNGEGDFQIHSYEGFILPKTNAIKWDSEVISYLNSDKSPYGIYSFPSIYTLSYSIFMNNYVVRNHFYNNFICDPYVSVETYSSEIINYIYKSLATRNINSTFLDLLKILGIKYLVINKFYTDFRPSFKIDALVWKLEKLTGLKLVLNGTSQLLYLNTRFSNFWIQNKLIQNDSFNFISSFENGSWRIINRKALLFDINQSSMQEYQTKYLISINVKFNKLFFGGAQLVLKEVK